MTADEQVQSMLEDLETGEDVEMAISMSHEQSTYAASNNDSDRGSSDEGHTNGAMFLQ
jgi:hypothetical protein